MVRVEELQILKQCKKTKEFKAMSTISYLFTIISSASKSEKTQLYINFEHFLHFPTRTKFKNWKKINKIHTHIHTQSRYDTTILSNTLLNDYSPKCTSTDISPCPRKHSQPTAPKFVVELVTGIRCSWSSAHFQFNQQTIKIGLHVYGHFAFHWENDYK